MNKSIVIAIDAMGGDDSPNKVIKGISIHHKTSNETNYKIFGNEKFIYPLFNSINIFLTNILIWFNFKFNFAQNFIYQ